MPTETNQIRLAGGCVVILARLGSTVSEMALKRAIEHAAQDDRTLIEVADIEAGLGEALADVRHQLQGSDASTKEHVTSAAECGYSI